MKEYNGEILNFYRVSARQERDGYLRPSDVIHPIKCRVEEIMEFAEKMEYKRLGLAFCIGLKEEVSIFTKILGNGGFDIVSVPIAQAAILNDDETEFNIVIGLCVGHDSLFFKHSEAPTTVLAAKDRLLGHNPPAALYTPKGYYSKLVRKRLLKCEYKF